MQTAPRWLYFNESAGQNDIDSIQDYVKDENNFIRGNITEFPIDIPIDAPLDGK